MCVAATVQTKSLEYATMQKIYAHNLNKNLQSFQRKLLGLVEVHYKQERCGINGNEWRGAKKNYCVSTYTDESKSRMHIAFHKIGNEIAVVSGNH